MRLSIVRESIVNEPVILLQGVSVRYRVPLERIRSFKEFTIKWLRRRMRYRDYWALREINLEVYRGQIVGVIGRNGAGKTTLLRVVARVVHPTVGRVRVRGQVAPLLSLGAGFQQDLTGRENILLNGVTLGYSRKDLLKRMNRIVEFSGIGTFIDLPLRTYSSGMRARLGFAIATDEMPDILLVDEVLAVGDVEFRQRCEERIEEYRQEGMTVLIVSHAPQILAKMCNQMVWLDGGRTAAMGSPGDVVGQYAASTGTAVAKA
ncbi:MAG: ABC transporter ATP-binding protein [Acidobacteria bacterium]|nr:ABC transporter ATP-binding protein [Acidobacteriota bacterium]